jgi:hypothetical protein
VTAAITRITEARRALEQAKRDLDVAEEASFKRFAELQVRLSKDEPLNKALKHIAEFGDLPSCAPRAGGGLGRELFESREFRRIRVQLAIEGIAAAIAFGLVEESPVICGHACKEPEREHLRCEMATGHAALHRAAVGDGSHTHYLWFENGRVSGGP